MKKFAVILTLFIATTFISSCKKNSDQVTYSSDKARLKSVIDSLTVVYTGAVEGKQAGNYSFGSRKVLDSSINLALGVNTGSFTKQQITNAIANLLRAGVQFNVNLLQLISAANLVASWTFTGNANDVSGNGNNGTLKTGWIGGYGVTQMDGGTLPILVTDRFGVTNNAYYFNNGAYIEVPYKNSLRPTSFTICAWIKPHAASNGNYIFSLDRWHGYKFQLQGSNLPFLTVMTDTGDHDQDDGGTSVVLDKWSQVIASFTNGTEKFYINGVLVKTANITGNPTALDSPPNVAIGNELPASAYNFTDPNSPNAYYGGNYFIGAIDDVHLYNTVLTDTQVNSLYTMEQP